MNKTLTCYLIDDEISAHIILEKYIDSLPYLTLLGHNDDPFDALEHVQHLRPDILFLDVEMPHMSGVELLKVLPQPHPAVIMVTGWPQFAAETYNFDSVIHYLIKPVGFGKFLEAINRVTKRLNFAIDPNPPAPASPPTDAINELSTDPHEAKSHFLIRADKKLVNVAAEEIIFVEGMRDYAKLYLTTGRTLVTHMTMGKLEDMLPPSQFLRINRSYIIRRQAIKEIDGNQITTIDGKKIVIGATYREQVMNELKKNII